MKALLERHRPPRGGCSVEMSDVPVCSFCWLVENDCGGGTPQRGKIQQTRILESVVVEADARSEWMEKQNDMPLIREPELGNNVVEIVKSSSKSPVVCKCESYHCRGRNPSIQTRLAKWRDSLLSIERQIPNARPNFTIN